MKNYSPLAKLFQATFFSKVADNSYSQMLSEIIRASHMEDAIPTEGPLLSILSAIYNLLTEKYRCEYIYKNAITNKIFLSRHSVKQSQLISEFRCGSSRTDISIFNGTSTVYEIKTEYDSFSKLKKQLEDYNSFFDKIFIVVPPNLTTKAKNFVSPHHGIITLESNLSLRTIRDAKSNKHNIKPSMVISSLRQTEYKSIAELILGQKLRVPNTLLYATCLEIFNSVLPSQIHDMAVTTLRKRNLKPSRENLIYSLPTSLKHVAFELSGSNTFFEQIHRNILCST